MRFTYLGATYEIEFQRNRRKKNTTDKGIAPSRLTTVRLYKTEAGKLPGELVGEASTACSTLDNFNLETGRIAALRLLTKELNKELKEAIWVSYTSRPKGTPNLLPQAKV